MQRRRLLQAAGAGGAGIAALALVGCNSDDGDGESGSTGSSQDADGPLADSQVIRQPFADDPVPFDPATLFRTSTEEVAFNLYSALVSYDADGKLVPDLAMEWEQPDPATFVFHLNKGVKWHGGYGELTSEDALYSFRRVVDPATASTYVNNFALVDTFSASDAYTLTVKLKSPDVNFLHQVANYHQGQIVRKQAIEGLGKDYGFKPVGTGPFFYEGLKPGEEMVLARFPEYFKGPATIEKVHFRFIKDPETAAIAFQNNELNVLGSTTNPQTLARLEADNRVALNKNDRGGNVGVLIFNGTNQYLKDPRVRKAFTHAIDRDAVIKITSPISGRNWHNLVPGWMDIYNPDVPKFEFNAAKAKELLSAASYKDGDITIKWLTREVADEEQLYQDYLSKVGMKLEFDIVDTPTYNSRRNKGEFDITTRSLPAVNPDDILFGFLHPANFPPKGFNGARFDNPTVTSLLESARTELDFEKRKSKYFEVQKLAMTDAPYMPRSHGTSMEIAFKWITGMKANPLGNMIYHNVKVLQA
jgi:peptide/nickel transport system substrate-binding protein